MRAINMLKFILLAVLTIAGTSIMAQNLVLDGGIYTEKPNPANKDKHQYSRDNTAYKMNKVFIYDYYYADRSGVKSKFLLKANPDPKNNPLNLTPYNRVTDSTIAKIKLSVTDSVETFWAYNADYTLTVMSYAYIIRNEQKNDSLANLYQSRNVTNRENTTNGVSTGVIDNVKNIWMHPPRQFSFKILQMSPFPFYVFDESVKNWSWKLDMAAPYLDKRWLNTDKDFQLQYNYVRQPDEVIKTPFGKIRCKVTLATGTAPAAVSIIKTSLKSYYHPDYGFVRLEYSNINESKMVIDLVEVRNGPK